MKQNLLKECYPEAFTPDTTATAEFIAATYGKSAGYKSPKQTWPAIGNLTDTDREALYIQALEKWAKRVSMWHQANKGPPPVLIDKNGKAHWVNRAQRRGK